MGRAVTIFKSCSTEKGEESLRNFYYFSILVLHTSLGGVTAPQQHKGHTEPERKGERRKRKENATANGDIFNFIYFFTHASRNGHSATAAANTKGDRQSKRREATEKNKKMG